MKMAAARHRRSRDEGVALVVALMLMWIVFLMATAVLIGAFHNLTSSGRSWRRLAAANAAESGVSQYLSFLESSSTSVQKLKAGGSWADVGGGYQWTRTISLPGSPSSASFTQLAQYYKDAGLTLSLDLTQYSDNDFPAELWVRLTSTGSSPDGCSASAPPCTRRAMQSVMRLSTLHGALTGAFAGMYICELGNRFTITGAFADLYFLGSGGAGLGAPCPSGDDFVLTSGSLTTSGNVYVLNGAANIQRSTKISGTLWAKNAVTLGKSCGGACKSWPVGSCSWNDPAQVLICGDAISGTATVTTGATAKVLGSSLTCLACGPGLPTFPKLTSSYYPGPYTSFSNFTTPGIYESSSCPATLPSGTLTLTGSVTIVSNCGFVFANRTEFRVAAGITPTPTLSLITLYSGGACSGSGDTRDSAIKQNFDASRIHLFLYTPCSLTLTNQVNLTGALVAGRLDVKGRTSISTVNLSLTGPQPGLVAGFRQQVLTLREVAV